MASASLANSLVFSASACASIIAFVLQFEQE
jgi:hypothetical protein